VIVCCILYKLVELIILIKKKKYKNFFYLNIINITIGFVTSIDYQ